MHGRLEAWRWIVLALAGAGWFLDSCLLDAGTAAAQTEPAPPIRAIELVGLSRLSTGEMLARLQTKPGDPFRPAVLDQITQDLWRSGEFASIEEPQVTRTPEGVTLVVRLVEKPRIDAVEVRGVERLDRRRVEDLLTTRAGGLFSASDARRDAQAIVRHYLELGFAFAEARHEQVVLPPARAGARATNLVVFLVNEGPKVRVMRIRFQGNQTFKDSELLRFMSTRPRSAFLGIPHAGLFDRDRWQTDLDNLRRFYVSRGFFEAAISAEDFSFDQARAQLVLGVRIDEGPRYRIGEVTFETAGTGIFPEAVLRRELRLVTGDPYNEERVQEDVQRLQRLYQKHSYLDCTVTRHPVHRLEGQLVDLRFVIAEGEQVYIEGIELRGNLETRDKVIRRELRFYPGEKINLERLEESQSNLYRLGYFDRVSFSFSDGSTPNQRSVVVDVEEGRTGSINVGFGVTSGQGAVGILSLTKRNFDYADAPTSLLDFPSAWTGGGQTLILQAQPGTVDSRYRFEFREPHLFDSNTSLFLRAYRTLLGRSEYDEKRLAGEIGIGNRLPWDPDLNLELSYRYELIEIDDIDASAPPDVFRVEGDNRLSGLQTALNYDKRRFRPQGLIIGGWLGSLTYEYTGGFLGAEVDVSKARATVAVYRTLYSRDDSHFHVLSWSNSFGWAEPHHNSREVPIFERYFLGGARTVRGFRYRELGPHVGRDPIGGVAMHYGSLEYTWPLVDTVLRGLAFVDYGNLEGALEQLAVDRYRVTLGAGLLINVNLLGQRIPIALTWGEAVRSQRQDSERLFLFDIGYGF